MSCICLGTRPRPGLLHFLQRLRPDLGGKDWTRHSPETALPALSVAHACIIPVCPARRPTGSLISEPGGRVDRRPRWPPPPHRCGCLFRKLYSLPARTLGPGRGLWHERCHKVFHHRTCLEKKTLMPAESKSRGALVFTFIKKTMKALAKISWTFCRFFLKSWGWEFIFFSSSPVSDSHEVCPYLALNQLKGSALHFVPRTMKLLPHLPGIADWAELLV